MGIISSIASLFGYNPLKDANKKAMAAQDAGYKEASAKFDPFLKAGTNALGAYADATGQGNSDQAIAQFKNSPLYRLQYDAAMKAGMDGVSNEGYGVGMHNSGRTLAAMQDRASQIGNNLYQQYATPIGATADMGLGVTRNLADLRTGRAGAKAQGYQNEGQIKAGNLAGFDNLLSGGLKLAGGFF